jgi:hypothetical protein
MNILKSKSDTQKQADKGRRSFLWKAGAGMSAVLAAAVPGYAKTVFSSDKNVKTNIDDLSRQVAILENEKSINVLHKQFEELLDNGRYSDIPGMFTDNAEVIFNGGVFKGNSGIKRLFCDCFASGMTGRRIDHAPGFELKPEQKNIIKITPAPDQKSAKAMFTYSIQVGAPIDSDSTLVKMARLQGEGIRKWWEGGVYELSYVNDAVKGWKIDRLEYKTMAKADYKPGRSYAKPISVPMFSKVYPAEPFGPDRLVKSV